jgi:hypothetical protein
MTCGLMLACADRLKKALRFGFWPSPQVIVLPPSTLLTIARIRMERNWASCRIQQSRMGHENSKSLFDRFLDWNCGWVGVMGVRHRANHLARSPSNGQLSADPGYDHRDSDYLASADPNEFTIIVVTKAIALTPSMSEDAILATTYTTAAQLARPH